MRRTLLIFAILAWVGPFGATQARAQTSTYSELPPASGSAGVQQVDGVAARIEDDIITESEVRELGAFQQLVDGKSKPRAELIRDLADQWLIRNEAATAKYAQPPAADVDRAYEEFVKQFSSRENFEKRCAESGITAAAVRRIVALQLYLARFIDYRFRPAAQVSDQQVEDYYRNEFTPQLKARNDPVPPLDDVEDTIREVLIQRAITDRSSKWLNDTRERLKIDVVSPGTGS
jgi:hypothetical protein